MSITDRGQVNKTPGVSADTTFVGPTFTPAAGALIVVCAMRDKQTGGASHTLTIADSWAGTSAWTQLVTAIDTGANYRARGSIWIATAGATPGSGFVTVTDSNNANNDRWDICNVFEITGQAGSQAGAATGSNTATNSATLAVTLSNAPAAGSIVIGFVNTGTNTTALITPPSGWTESQDVPAPSSWGDEFESAYIIGGSATTVTWGGCNTTDVTVGMAVEILMAAASSPTYPPGNMRPNSRSRHVAARAARRGNTLMNWTQIAAAPPNWNSNAIRSSARRLVRNTRRPNTFRVPAQLNPPFQQNALSQVRNNRRFMRVIDRPAPSFAPPQQAVASPILTPRLSRKRVYGAWSTRARDSAPFLATPTIDKRYPSAVSSDGHRLLDQYGQTWMGIGDSAWSMAGQLNDSDIDQFVANRAAKGINCFIISAPEHKYADNAPNNIDGVAPFTGTAYQSSLNNTYWTRVDRIVQKALANGITVFMCPEYSGFDGDDTQGWRTEIEAAYTASSTNIVNYGKQLAIRYGGYRNIVWFMGHDRTFNSFATLKTAVKLMTDTIQANVPNHQLVLAGGGVRGTVGSTVWSGIDKIAYDVDNIYISNADPGGAMTSAYSSGAPAGVIEAYYEQEHSLGFGSADLRNQTYSPIAAGAVYSFFGNNPIWYFGSTAGAGFGTPSGTWQQNMDQTGSLHLAIAARYFTDPVFLANRAAMAPDLSSTFLTIGSGSGATKAYALYSSSRGIVWQPAASGITISLAVFSAPVRIRWFDPTNGQYKVVSAKVANSGTQAISHPGNNSFGASDWLLDVDLYVPIWPGNNASPPYARRFNKLTRHSAAAVPLAQASAPVNPGFQQLALRQAGRKVLALRRHTSLGHIPGQGVPALHVPLRQTGRRALMLKDRPAPTTIPAQLNPPFQQKALTSPPRRIAALRRHSNVVVVPTQQNPPFQRNANIQPRNRNFVRAVDRPAPTVVPAQQAAPVNPDFQRNNLNQAGRRATMVRRGSRPGLIPAQLNPPFQRNANIQPRNRTFVRVIKRPTLMPTPAQQALPVNPAFTTNFLSRAGRKIAALRHGSAPGVVPAQQAAPTNPDFQRNNLGPIVRKLAVIRRRPSPSHVAGQGAPPLHRNVGQTYRKAATVRRRQIQIVPGQAIPPKYVTPIGRNTRRPFGYVPKHRVANVPLPQAVPPPTPKFVSSGRRNARYALLSTARRNLQSHLVYQHGVWRLKIWNGSQWVSHPVKEYKGGAWVLATNVKAFAPNTLVWTQLNT